MLNSHRLTQFWLTIDKQKAPLIHHVMNSAIDLILTWVTAAEPLFWPKVHACFKNTSMNGCEQNTIKSGCQSYENSQECSCFPNIEELLKKCIQIDCETHVKIFPFNYAKNVQYCNFLTTDVKCTWNYLFHGIVSLTTCILFSCIVMSWSCELLQTMTIPVYIKLFTFAKLHEV